MMSFNHGLPHPSWKRGSSRRAMENTVQTIYDLCPDAELHRVPAHFPDIKDDFFWETFEKCRAYSLLTIEAFYNLYCSVKYIATYQIPGDIVECGVFLGGAILAAGDFAHHFGLTGRRIFLYDSFTGFPEGVCEIDVTGKTHNLPLHDNFLAVTKEVVARSVYPMENFVYVAGIVEETVRQHKPAAIAILRLDTDYYQSTRMELEELYPLLTRGGVLIVDDYGQFNGVRRATDEYFSAEDRKILLVRASYAVRCGIKM